MTPLTPSAVPLAHRALASAGSALMNPISRREAVRERTASEALEIEVLDRFWTGDN